MSRIDDLIEEHCAGGVRFRTLGEIVEIAKRRVDPAGLDESTYVGVDNLLPNFGGRTNSGYGANSSGAIAFQAGDILIGNIRPYLKKVWLADRDGGASPDVLTLSMRSGVADVLLPKFLYYLIASDSFIGYSMRHAKGAKMPRGDKVATLRYRIPVPPLAIQREIASILDRTKSLKAELEAELEAELDLRGRQYAFCRDQLLTFRGAGVRWIPMGDLGGIFGGLTGKSKADFSGGNARFVSYVNVFNNLAVDTERDDFVRIGPDERQRSLQRGDVLFTGSSESAADVAMSSVVTGVPDGPLYLNSFCIGFRPHQPDELEPEFSKHLFRSGPMRSELVRTGNGVTRFNVSKARLAKVKVPIPPLADQRRIASLLNKLDTLVSDLSIGLPAEIRARRKQYEYYRDKLLTFAEAA